MAHPGTRTELLEQTRTERDSLLDRLAGLSPEEAVRPGPYGWSARDFVAHLADWERLLFGWYETDRRGQRPAVPAEGYTWRTMDALNEDLRQRHLQESMAEVTADWRRSSARLIEFVEKLPEDDLFGKKRFAWTGTSTLAGYVYECGANHYRWAAREIEKALKG
jgi:hypothetical protein